jgi:hypothetical protein
MFLTRCRETLRPGGILRIVVPDLAHLVEEYRQGKIPAVDFAERLGVLFHPTGNPLKDRLALLVQSPHKCMYDAPALLSAVRDAGLAATASTPLQSAMPDIAVIELPERTEHAVIVEGRRE